MADGWRPKAIINQPRQPDRLMDAAICQRPNRASRRGRTKIYPSMLREPNRPAQSARCSDVPYIPMAKGFLYLVVIMDG